MRNPHALAPAVLTAFLALAPATAQEHAPLDARSFAQRVEVAASPVHAFRYNQPIPAPNQTKALLTRRRAFYPGERVSLSFRLPPGATLAAPLRERVVLSLHGLLGAKLADLGEAAVSAAPAGASGTLDWTVPDVAEGQYLLAARFYGEDGAPLTTRSNVVFLTPEYPRLLAAAQAALVPARQKAARPRRTPTASRRARTRGRPAPAPSRRRTAPRSTARCSPTHCTCRPPATRRRRRR